MICTTYFLTFFSELIPPTGKFRMKVSLKYFGVAFLIWVVGTMAGVVLSTSNADGSFNTDHGIEQDIVKALSSDNNVKAFILIASNNLKVAAINIIGGVLFGIPIVLSMLFNGFAFGSTYSQLYSAGFSLDFMAKYTLPHSFELVAIWWSAMIGFMIARKLILIIRKHQMPTINEYKLLIINILTVCCVIVLAAFVEVFITVNL